MANEEHVALLKQGVAVWNQWREENRDVIPFLVSADLSELELKGVQLNSAWLMSAKLNYADLRYANLRGAKLGSADLGGAVLYGADLRKSTLLQANLADVDLFMAILDGSQVGGMNCTGARFGHTMIGDIDLSQVKGLDTVVHNAPSTIGIGSIYLSHGNIPDAFLRGIGIPIEHIAKIKALAGRDGQQ